MKEKKEEGKCRMLEELINKRCKLVFKSGFILRGRPIEITQYGVVFKTNTKSSYTSFDEILELKELIE